MSSEVGDAEREVERLRERVAALEEQLIETESWAHDAVAEAQEKTYWLDRWHVDLNALMRRRGASSLRAALRAVRGVHRRIRRMKRRFLA